jgi:LacI family transcriptional regulator
VGDDAARKMGVSRGTNVIAMVMPHLKQPEFSFILQSLQQAAKDSPFVVGAYATDDNTETYARIIREQIAGGARGIVLVPPLSGTIVTDVLIELYNSRIPVVTCFRPIEGFGWPLVQTDFVNNAKTATRHLCAIGRKNIGLVTLDRPDSYHHFANEHAYEEVLDEFGLMTRRSMRLSLNSMDMVENCSEMWLFRAINEVEGWLAANPGIDAVACLHDLAAWPVLSALAKNHQRVPEDVAVVGNGNLLATMGLGNSDLSTVDCCYDELGRVVFNLIDEMANGRAVEANLKVKVKGNLIIRHSSAVNAA